MKTLFVLVLAPLFSFSQAFSGDEIKSYRLQAERVTIVRDKWGIPHIYGKSDADAVFGLLYAQCEENFRKVEENNLEMLGRLSEVFGESRLYNDLQMRLIYDTAAAIEDYRRAPAWMKKLLDAAANGVNYYLYQHPEVRPAVLQRFEPWFALLRTNGSISATQTGGITTSDMSELYPLQHNATSMLDNKAGFYETEPTGSNGFAVSAARTASKKAILYINPHVTFYYRTEVQMVSEEGLNAYGAVTWGTFFVFQGFNEYCGWMHTSGVTDVADLYVEQTISRNDSIFTMYDGKMLPVRSRQVSIRSRKGERFEEQQFTTYHTIHGPVMGSRKGKWLSVRESNRSLNALMQSWLRTKAKGFEEFKKIMEMRANTSDNTVFADNKGNIAYWHGNFVPRRSPKFDYSLPVDGSISETDWHGIFGLDEIVHVYNPRTAFIQNCNSTPFTVSGTSSPKKRNYPLYMAPDGQNFRGLNASRLLTHAGNLTIDKMISDIGYDRRLMAFDDLIPVLLQDFKSMGTSGLLRRKLESQIDSLGSWNRYSSVYSAATTLAVEFGYRFLRKAPPPANPYESSNAVGMMKAAIAATTARERLQLLSETSDDLETRFGTWKVAWGMVNRYQRPADGQFSDSLASLPVGLAAATFGCLPSFASQRFPQTDKRYGTSGNSFVACVEFGTRIKAKSVVTGGQYFDPSSSHYRDQAHLYLVGIFKDVLFYRDEVLKNAERSYRPGE